MSAFSSSSSSSAAPAGFGLERFKPDDECHITNWCEPLTELTFACRVIKLTKSEAKALARLREVEQRRELLIRWGTAEDHEAFRSSNNKDYASGDLAQLYVRLNEAIHSWDNNTSTSSEGGAFCRLSTRSPKDAVLKGSRIKELIRNEIELRKDGGDDDDDLVNVVARDLVTYVRACSFANRVYSADEVLDLFAKSQRTYADLTRTLLEQSERDDDEFQMELVVREWRDIAVEYEFRVFVVEQRVVAISCYYALCYVPRIAENVDAIRDAIVDFFERRLKPIISAKLSLRTYTVDVVLDPDDFANMQVVELNHPPPLAGTALFDWDDENDRRLLTTPLSDGDGDGDIGPLMPAIRVVLEPHEPYAALAKLHTPLRIFMDELHGRQVVVHEHHRCDACGAHPIIGSRWHCSQCAIDACDQCAPAILARKLRLPEHNVEKHGFIEFRSADGDQVQPSSSSLIGIVMPLSAVALFAASHFYRFH
jgi:D123/Zinc finger, ZZ type